MGLVEETMEDIRKKENPTQQETMKANYERMFLMRKKFISLMIDLVEKSVIDKRKTVVIPTSRREDIPKMRKLIKRIAKGFGFKVKSVKRRCITVEKTQFIVNRIQTPKVKISDPIKTEINSPASVKKVEVN